ncbi:hypothetical protein [Rufibacter sp. LB8]|uniref:hypothetical protein n=1 Tax=Rufibacter sp. LB8 TaxID=2777781 RepID=UPI00178C389F|nr:hypothetical protein [Rufibacter sp. LB8]
MKHFINCGSFLMKTFFVAFFCLLASQTVSAQALYKNNFRTGVGFAYIVEGDNSGAIFSQQYTRELSDRLNLSVSGEYLSSSRYDQGQKIFTSRKAFVMFDAAVSWDLTEHPTYGVKIGVGPAVRRRSEVDLKTGLSGNDVNNYIHSRERDFGGKVFLENDFYSDNRLFFGGRAAGYFYNKGSNIFAISVNMGYAF